MYRVHVVPGATANGTLEVYGAPPLSVVLSEQLRLQPTSFAYDPPEQVIAEEVVEITAGALSEESTHLRSSALGGMMQSMHAVAPVLLYFPAGQKPQSSVLSPALYFPASHAVHWPALALAWHGCVCASTGSLSSPLIPPQAVRRSPSVQLPHFMHLSFDTRTSAGFAAGGGNHGRGSGWAPSRKLSRFKLSGRAGPCWSRPCSSPPHTARNYPRRRAWVEANRRCWRPPSGVWAA
eukprot:scaffold19910_cov70-Phaeocystis_antarctica.AAC.5